MTVTLSNRALLLSVGVTLLDAREIIAHQREAIIESHCKLDKKLQPRLHTLECRVRPKVRELKELIRDIDRSVRVIRKITQ